ncbi:metallo-beta-lactamase superfamily protein [Mycobacterium xenopi 4042]|uniref:Metallo-beta-lactamase superfamily protein n=1 Tax=Mycobacterium xenopi 4042 TaxID=1299334 RepID=X7YPC9_MYCXE|nr:metallo-beta-lactamase superfamily protein [Mycobacterium xenopi 4042]
MTALDDNYTGHVDPAPRRGAPCRRDDHQGIGGPMDNNTYLVTCSETGETLLIDAANDADVLLDLVRRYAPKVSLIVTSHQHWDHWQALQALAEATGAPTAAHEIDAGPLPVKPDRLLAHGDTVQIGKLNFDVLHLRGHTPGLSHWRSMDPQPATSRSCSPATACFLAASARRGSPVISRSCSTMSSPGCSTALGRHCRLPRPRRRHHPRCGASALGGVARARLVGPRGTARRHAVTVPKPGRVNRWRRLPGYAAALVFGALPALAFPAPAQWWLAWVGWSRCCWCCAQRRRRSTPGCERGSAWPAMC